MNGAGGDVPHYIIGTLGFNGSVDGTAYIVVVPSPPWEYADA